jgi:dolichol-phosphate mannosyltransferase
VPMEVKSLEEYKFTGIPDLLSVVIPAHNEEEQLRDTVESIAQALDAAHIRYEIVVVNDNSQDSTAEIVSALERANRAVRHVNNGPPNGFGLAVRRGLVELRGDVVAIMMGDGSDSPEDLVTFYRKLHEGYDCAFGSRFMRGGCTIGYPFMKLVLNRLGNKFIQLLFGLSCNDISNAFKLYRRSVLPACSHCLPLNSI